jgi:hypothetical protein
MSSQSSKMIVYVSVGILMVAGVVLIFEGITYLKAKQANPNLPDKVNVAAYLAIVLGCVEILFGIWHFMSHT